MLFYDSFKDGHSKMFWMNIYIICAVAAFTIRAIHHVVTCNKFRLKHRYNPGLLIAIHSYTCTHTPILTQYSHPRISLMPILMTTETTSAVCATSIAVYTLTAAAVVVVDVAKVSHFSTQWKDGGDLKRLCSVRHTLAFLTFSQESHSKS